MPFRSSPKRGGRGTPGIPSSPPVTVVHWYAVKKNIWFSANVSMMK